MLTEVSAVSGVALVASMIGTIAGFGISTVMIPVLVLWIPLPEVLLLVAVVHLANDLWKMVLFRSGVRWRLVVLFGGTGVATSYLGAWLSQYGTSWPLERLLGGFLVAYVVFVLYASNWKLPRTDPTALAGGAASGLVAGFFGIGGAVRSTFLTAFDLPKSVYLFTTGIIAFAIDTARIGGYVAGDTRLPAELWVALAVAVPATLAGAAAAKRLVGAIPERRFRGVIALFLFAMGVRLIVLG